MNNHSVIKQDLMRVCYFRPYLKGKGPTFILKLFDIPSGIQARYWVNFELWMKSDEVRTLLFDDKFSPSPDFSIDSDDCVYQLMRNVVNCQFDVGIDQWENYSDIQKDFSQKYADDLKIAIMDRFERNRR